MPDGVVTHLEARLLKEVVNREIHPIRCAASCRRKFQKGMYLGDLCAETGHFVWALRVWGLAASLIEEKDINDWIDVWFDNKRVRLTDVISETEYEVLVRRCCDLYKALGFPEDYWWTENMERTASETFGTSYHYLFGEKYDSNWYPDELQREWDAEMDECRKQQETAIIFRDGQGENLPPCSQDFTDYWHGGPRAEDFR